MMGKYEHLVDRTSVHRIDEKNVLIHHARRAMPPFITKADFEKMEQSFTPPNKKLLVKVYRPMTSLEEAFSNITKGYTVNTLQSTIDFNKINECEGISKEKLHTILEQYYDINEGKTQYILKKIPKENHEKQINRYLGHRDLHINNDVRYLLSKEMESCDVGTKNRIYYANMNVDVTHDFFFEHHNEHVPGIMLIEAARQFGLVVGHLYGKAPVDAVQIILGSVKVVFYNYAELSMPINIMGIADRIVESKHGYWGEIDLSVRFYQLDDEIARFEISARGAPKRIYSIMRKRRIDSYLGNYRYVPRKQFKHNMSFRPQDRKDLAACKLIDISLKGFKIDTEGEFSLVPGDACDFIIHSGDVGVIYGIAHCKWKSASGYQGGFLIVTIAKHELETLKEFIIKRCLANTERYIL